MLKIATDLNAEGGDRFMVAQRILIKERRHCGRHLHCEVGLISPGATCSAFHSFTINVFKIAFAELLTLLSTFGT